MRYTLVLLSFIVLAASCASSPAPAIQSAVEARTVALNAV